MVSLCYDAETRGGKLTSHDANLPNAWIAFALATMLYVEDKIHFSAETSELYHNPNFGP